MPSGHSAESCSYNAHRTNYEAIAGGDQATSDGTNPWTYSNLQSLIMICTKDGTVEVHLSYLALRVFYTPAGAENATFFGANF